MKLTFRTIKGTTFNMEAEATTTVGDLKANVESSQGPQFPKDQLKLIYKGKVLDDDAKTVSDYGVDESGFLVVFMQKKAEGKPAAAAGGASSSAAPAAAEAFDMFGGGGGGGGAGAAGGEAGAAAGPLDFLRGNPQFQLLRRAVQANPDILAPMLQELRKQNPQLMQQISQNQAEFMRMVMEAPEEGEEEEMAQMAQLLGAMRGGAGAAGGEGGLPPGVMAIELTEADDAAIQRLQGLGFDRDACIEAYLACDKNEEIAANFLLEGGFGND
eukprot:gene2326-2634_t